MSSEINRCEKCRGRKKIVGLGNIEKKCPECLGIGFVKIEKLPETKIDDDIKIIEVNDIIETEGVAVIDKRTREYKKKVRS